MGGAGRQRLSQRRGRGATSVTNTTAGGTNITCTITGGGTALSWFSQPLTVGITISGTMGVQVFGFESANNVNAGAGILVERTDNSGTVLSAIVNDIAFGTEYLTGGAVRNNLSVTPTSTTMSAGDRIKVTVKVRNVGTMGAGTVTNSYDGAVANNTGDAFIRFTENIITDEVVEVPFFEIRGRNAYYG